MQPMRPIRPPSPSPVAYVCDVHLPSPRPIYLTTTCLHLISYQVIIIILLYTFIAIGTTTN